MTQLQKKKMNYINSFIVLLLLGVVACTNPNLPQNTSLPLLGKHKVSESGDTTYHTIRDFQFVNQDSLAVNNATFEGNIYIVDFFFISCPTICPKVKKQMLRLYERYETNDRVQFLSHTIDVKHDTIPRLKKYAESLGVNAPKWNFVTGEKEAIYDIADDYMSIAKEDPNAPGGFDHSGWLIVVDENRHIRSFCNGTKAEEVDRLMEDIDWLIKQ